MLCRRFDVSKVFTDQFEQLVASGELESILYENAMKKRLQSGTTELYTANIEEIVRLEQQEKIKELRRLARQIDK